MNAIRFSVGRVRISSWPGPNTVELKIQKDRYAKGEMSEFYIEREDLADIVSALTKFKEMLDEEEKEM